MLNKFRVEFKNLISEHKKNVLFKDKSHTPSNMLGDLENHSPLQQEFEQKNTELKKLFQFDSNGAAEKAAYSQQKNQYISRMIPAIICVGLVSTVFFSSIKHSVYKNNQSSQLSPYANPFNVIYSGNNNATSKLLGLGTTDFSTQHISLSHNFEKLKFRQDLTLSFIQMKPEDAQKYFDSKNIVRFDDKTNVAISSYKPINANFSQSSAVIITDHVLSPEEKQKIVNSWKNTFPTDGDITKAEISTLSENMVSNLHKDINLFTPIKNKQDTSLNFKDNYAPSNNNLNSINKDATEKINAELNKVTQENIKNMQEKK